MIPTFTSIDDDLKNDFEIIAGTDIPTNTYKLRVETNRVQGYTDEQKAMKQAAFKILQTERYQFSKIYGDDYGVELQELIGQPIPYVLPELERRITEALEWDERIESVDNFEFDVKKGKVTATFTIHTIFGDVDFEKVIII